MLSTAYQESEISVSPRFGTLSFYMGELMQSNVGATPYNMALKLTVASSLAIPSRRQLSADVRRTWKEGS